jgi:hypothetical protein
MAHSTLHFSAGWILGSIFTAPSLARAWAGRQHLSLRFRNWFLVSYAMGIYAVMPGILRRLGVPDAVCDGWWMNIFVLYPLINDIKRGAVTSGPLMLGACLGFQYVLLVAAVWRCRRRGQALQQ